MQILFNASKFDRTTSSRTFRRRLTLGVCLISAALAPHLVAGTSFFDWSGGSSNWNSSLNWFGLGQPSSSDDVRFSSTGLATVTLSAAGFANSITFLSGASAFTIAGSQTLTTSDITNSSTNLQTFSVSTLALAANANWSANTGALSFSSAVSMGTRSLTLKSSGGQSSDISGQISGSGALNVQSGTWTLSNSGNNYTGSTNVSGGTLAVAANGALGNISGGTSITGGGTLDLRNVNYSSAQPISAGSSNIMVSTGTSSFAGPIAMSGGSVVLTLNVTGTALTLSGVISGGGAENISKIGAGTLTFSGASANTYGGATIISAGTLILAKSPGVNAIATGNITVNTGGVLQLGASNQIGNNVNMVLNGGTFQANNFTESLGKLDLTLTGGTIDFGGTAAALAFLNSSAENWNGGTLAITSYITGSNSLRFGTNATGLTSTQLGSIIFEGYGIGALIDASGYVTPVPEPAVWAALFGVIALTAANQRRRKA